jgi:hypothetical protein
MRTCAPSRSEALAIGRLTFSRAPLFVLRCAHLLWLTCAHCHGVWSQETVGSCSVRGHWPLVMGRLTCSWTWLLVQRCVLLLRRMRALSRGVVSRDGRELPCTWPLAIGRLTCSWTFTIGAAPCTPLAAHARTVKGCCRQRWSGEAVVAPGHRALPCSQILLLVLRCACLLWRTCAHRQGVLSQETVRSCRVRGHWPSGA